jgi:hypothetical protein
MFRQPLPKLVLSLIIAGAAAVLIALGIIWLTTDARIARADAGKEPVIIPAVPSPEAVPETGADAFTRPMFHRDRALGPDKAPIAPATDPADPSDPASPDTTTAGPGDASAIAVKGIIINGNGARAALQSSGSTELTWVRRGDTFDGWKVDSIGANSVRISNGDEVVEVKVRKDK